MYVCICAYIYIYMYYKYEYITLFIIAFNTTIPFSQVRLFHAVAVALVICTKLAVHTTIAVAVSIIPGGVSTSTS